MLAVLQQAGCGDNGNNSQNHISKASNTPFLTTYAALKFLNIVVRKSCFLLGLFAAIFCFLGLAQNAEARKPTLADFNVSVFAQIEQPLEVGEYFWDETGAPAGSIRIVVDLKAEQLYVYRGGVEIGRSWILYGADEKPTPTGYFNILEKDIDHYSNLYNNAPMPYMLRLTWGGVAIHGSEIDWEYATHGCIGLPDEFAAILFRHAKKGDKVMVTRNWMVAAYAPQSKML